MRFIAILNCDGGSLRTTDIDAFSARMRETLEKSGHAVEIRRVSGDDLEAALDLAVAGDAEVVLAGGGDGTISAAAGKLMGTSKALAVLPAGTMNLFARGLGIPLALDEAVSAFADGRIRPVDIATANGRPFVHQFSIGMHARMVQLRSRMQFASRLGKLGASARAAWSTIVNPRALRVRLDAGGTEIEARATAVGITNNLFGEGHLPYADRPSGGVLGIYLTVARQRGELLRLFLKLARGKWRNNDQVEIHQAGRVLVTIVSWRKNLPATIDGELIRLDRETDCRIHPGSLNVLVPASGVEAEDRLGDAVDEPEMTPESTTGLRGTSRPAAPALRANICRPTFY